MARLRALETSTRQALDARFEWIGVPAGQAQKPSEINSSHSVRNAAQVPGTIASADRALGAFAFGAKDYDELDYWYEADVSLPVEGHVSLVFDGLATLAEVFWNDESILVSSNMFLSHRVDLSARARTGRLSLRFRSLKAALKERRPRPRWKTKLVDNQQLRWVRTTLLGRIPAWCPPVAPVGPYKPIWIDTAASFVPHMSADLIEGHGVVNFRAAVPAELKVTRASLQIAEQSFDLAISGPAHGEPMISGSARLQNPELWWPHTHGSPKLYGVALTLETTTGVLHYDCGRVGFRSVTLDDAEGAFHIQVNGQGLFCRGACWTPSDLISLGTAEPELRRTLTLVRDAGMNMIRIGGTMIYEADVFYDLCDELGIMVWQDFMFANMDYPIADEAFLASVREEARQFLSRTQLNACLVVACGNSEVEQQVAMLGLPAEQWSNEFFREELPRICREYRDDLIYWQSSPHGGALPFHTDRGVSHYYGVGAYQRPLSDARRANVRFTSETLGFSHVPETAAVEGLLGEGQSPAVHPKWKERVTRDLGAGWDFEDIRDHYVEDLFGVNPKAIRYADSDRYLALGRVTTGDVVARTLGEWRRPASTCKGALLWLLKDMWLGAGWGVIDADNQPKAAYYFAKRAMASQAVFFSDEGLNGLDIHVINERPEALDATLHVRFLRQGQTEVAAAQHALHLAARSSESIRAQTLFPYFIDMAYAYRFGPLSHDAAVVTLVHNGTGAIISEDWFFPEGHSNIQHADLGLEAFFVKDEDGALVLEITTKRHAQFVAIDAKGCVPDTNYFHVAPGQTYRVAMKDVAGSPQGSVSALNAFRPVKIVSKGSS